MTYFTRALVSVKNSSSLQWHLILQWWGQMWNFWTAHKWCMGEKDVTRNCCWVWNQGPHPISHRTAPPSLTPKICHTIHQIKHFSSVLCMRQPIYWKTYKKHMDYCILGVLQFGKQVPTSQKQHISTNCWHLPHLPCRIHTRAIQLQCKMLNLVTLYQIWFPSIYQKHTAASHLGSYIPNYHTKMSVNNEKWGVRYSKQRRLSKPYSLVGKHFGGTQYVLLTLYDKQGRHHVMILFSDYNWFTSLHWKN